MQFRNLELDGFQEEAIGYIEKGYSVIVSAATGTGKTLIADYVIDKYIKQGKRVFYTAPIKALSNQKFSEFKRLYGIENVGILTGDVSYNPSAPIVIMTTEIYRNMLLTKDPMLETLVYVIFDEIHYLGDYERGTVWEEAIIFSSNKVRFLCLSATIPNAKQFANWMEQIKKHDVKVVTEKKRAVPLNHLFYDNISGICTLDELKERIEQDRYPKYNDFFGRKTKLRKATHLELVDQLEKRAMLPCIYFCFSRSSTEKKAEELSRKMDLSVDSTLAITITREKLRSLDEDLKGLKTTRVLRECIAKGIAFHHAGLMPVLKEIVEELFEKGLIKVLYATETFAVGINMPAKTVCFDSLEKYDGISFRFLNSKEYFQLAGRAGRRGIDEVGYAISYVDREFVDLKKVEYITTDDKEQLKSQYKLSYNTILNLIKNHTEHERKIILESSFYNYQRSMRDLHIVMAKYENKLGRLEKLGYLSKGVLTDKGLFASKIYSHEIVISEVFSTDISKRLDSFEIMLLCASLEYEAKRNIKFEKAEYVKTRRLLQKLPTKLQKYFAKTDMHKLEHLLNIWYNQGSFGDLLALTNIPEGDIIRFLRRIIDMLQQVMHASLDTDLVVKIEHIIQRIDRDIVKVNL